MPRPRIVTDPRPTKAILPLLKLKRHTGKTIRIVASRLGFTIKDVIYEVPRENRDINRRFRHGWYWDWVLNSEEPRLREGDKLRVYPATSLEAKLVGQRFAQGVSHCVLEPIAIWCEAKLAEASGQTEKKYAAMSKKIAAYAEKYKRGIPEEDLAGIADNLNLDIRVDMPFSKTVFLEALSSKKALRAFHFLNTRLDHVDVGSWSDVARRDRESIILSRDEMAATVAELAAEQVFFIYNKDKVGVTACSTLHDVFAIENEYAKTVAAFEQETGLANVKIDDVANNELSIYILRGLHYNIASVDFKPVPDDTSDLACIDIVTSYASFHMCDLYEGFPHKLTDFRQTDKIQGPGFYTITQMDWTGADLKFKDICKRLGSPYRNYNVYQVPDLRLLDSMGVAYVIVEGCWAGGHECNLDFRFPGTKAERTGMFQKDDSGVAYYAKWVGACSSVNRLQRFYIKATKTYLQQIKRMSPAANVELFADGEACVSYPRKYAMHLSQITAYINAYERINLIHQLMQMDVGRVVRISKDSVIYERHDFEVKPYMREKPLPSFLNEPASAYATNIDDEDIPIVQHTPRESHATEANLGVGGGGKTHRNIVDTGLLNVMYIAPSWKLARAKQAEYGCKVTVWARALHDAPEYVQGVARGASVLIWDEVSQMWERDARKALLRFPHHKHIFCGDPGYQLPPILPMGETQDLVPFSAATVEAMGGAVYRFNTNYRCKCSKLNEILVTLRSMIDDNVTPQEMTEWVVRRFESEQRVIDFETAVKRYKLADLVLVARTMYGEEYTSTIEGATPAATSATIKAAGGKCKLTLNAHKLRKWRITTNTATAQNGQIVVSSEKPKGGAEMQHAFTVHSVQGETAKDVLFIDARHMFETQHWYTSIGRAQTIEQVYIINPPLPHPEGAYTHAKMYKILNQEGLCYIGHTTGTLQARFMQHKAAHKNGDLKKRCSSAAVFESGTARIQLIEIWPCASKREAEAREAFWIAKTPCVNKVMPTQTRAEYNEQMERQAKRQRKE